MVSERLIEHGVEDDLLLPQAALRRIADRELKAGVNDRSSLKATGAVLFAFLEELQSAGRDARCLLSEASSRFAADR